MAAAWPQACLTEGAPSRSNLRLDLLRVQIQISIKAVVDGIERVLARRRSGTVQLSIYLVAH